MNQQMIDKHLQDINELGFDKTLILDTQDRYEFLTKLNYSEQEKQAINLYYEKLNKSKFSDNIPKKSKNKDIIDDKYIKYKDAEKNILQFLEDNKPKQCLEFS